jgi:hypothetical protein
MTDDQTSDVDGRIVGEGSLVAMFKGVGEEWLPTLEVSWLVPQVPCRAGITPATRPRAAKASLKLAAPVMGICRVLKRCSPRAMERRAADCASWSSSTVTA